MRLIVVVVVVAGLAASMACGKKSRTPVDEHRLSHPEEALAEAAAAKRAAVDAGPVASARAPEEAPKRTVLRSHIVDGQVVIEEVPAELAAAEVRPPPAPVPTPNTTTPSSPAPAATREVLPNGASPPSTAAARNDARSVEVVLAAAAAEPDLDKKIALLEEGEKKLPSDAAAFQRAQFFSAMGNAYEAENDGLHALYSFERAADLNPSLQHRLDEIKKKQEVEKYFTQVKNERFVARFEGDDDKVLAEGALQILDDAWREIGDKIDVRPTGQVTVIFYTSEKFATTINAPDWTGGVYDGKIRVSKGDWYLNHGAVRDLLFHEYTHALVHTLKSGVPVWMNEGLAQHMQEHAQNRWTLNGLKQPGGRKRLPTLKALAGGGFYGKSYKNDAEGARVGYACGLDLVDFLVELRGERSLKDLFAELKEGKPFADAVLDVYGLTQDQLESKWRERFPE